MDNEYSFWYGVKVWKQLDLFGEDSCIDIVQDGGHIVLNETEKFLCKKKKETVMEKMGFDKDKVVSKRIENTNLCPKCLSEWIERSSIRHKVPIVVTYEVKGVQA